MGPFSARQATREATPMHSTSSVSQRLGRICGVGGGITELGQGAGQHVDPKCLLGEKAEGQSVSMEISLEEGTQTSRRRLDQGWAGNS